MMHSGKVDIYDGDVPVEHTPELITKLFDEELSTIVRKLPEYERDVEHLRYADARRISEEMILSGEFDPI